MLYPCIWTSLIGYFFSWRFQKSYAKTSHTSFPLHQEISIAQASLERYGFDFTRLETASLLRLCQKYHTVERVRLTENEVAG